MNVIPLLLHLIYGLPLVNTILISLVLLCFHLLVLLDCVVVVCCHGVYAIGWEFHTTLLETYHRKVLIHSRN
jgi:hypothetical protein